MLDLTTNSNYSSEVTMITSQQGDTTLIPSHKASRIQIVHILRHIPHQMERKRITKFGTAGIRSAGGRHSSNKREAKQKAKDKEEMTREVVHDRGNGLLQNNESVGLDKKSQSASSEKEIVDILRRKKLWGN